jgi:cell shape-determining protein MreC
LIAEITGYIEKKEMVTMFDAVVKRALKMKKEGYNEAKAEDREQIRQDQEQMAAKDERIQQLKEENRRLRESR